MAAPVLPDVAIPTTFGGPYADPDPVQDPTTEVASAFFNRMRAQVAMLSHTAPRAWVRVTVAAGVATLADHDAVWGNTAPVAPVVARLGAGSFTVTWAAAYTDLRDDGSAESHSVTIRAINVGLKTSGAILAHSYAISSPNIAGLNVYNSVSAGTDPAEFTLFVW